MKLYLNISHFLSAKHWVTRDGVTGQPHTHTWEVSLEILGDRFNRPFLEYGFVEVESVVKSYLACYENQTLNLIEPFNKISPTTENLGVYFAEGLKRILSQHGFVLTKLSIRESPTRGFTVSLMDSEHEGNVAVDFFQDNFIMDHCGTSLGIGEKGKEEPPPEQQVEQTEDDAEKEIAAGLEEPVHAVEQKPEEKKKWPILIALAVIFAFNLLLYAPVLFNGSYLPWGSDAWGHLYKADFLYKSIQAGDFFPRYLSGWYNGIDPFRYWAPLPYYFLSLIRFFAGDIFQSFGIYLFALSVFGSSCWLLLRKKLSLLTTVALALLWAVGIDNLRVIFSEGNIPRATALAFLPLLIYLVLEAADIGKKNMIKKLLLAVTVSFVILSHAMMGALFLLNITLFLFFTFAFGGIDFKSFIKNVLWLGLGVALSCWWLLPSLSGGITAISGDAVAGTMNFYSPLKALNPILRLKNPETVYFGLGYLLLAGVAFYNWRFKKAFQKAGIITGLVIFILATTLVQKFYVKLPLYHILWPGYSLPAGIAFLLLGSVDLTRLKEIATGKKVLTFGLIAILAVVLAADSLISAKVLIKSRDYPSNIDKVLEKTLTSKGFKVALLDLSREGSVPSYMVPAKYKREMVYGWAWQGAKTGQNIVMLNSAIEKEWYDFLFDRLVEIGATELLVRKDLIKKFNLFNEKASVFGYKQVYEQDNLVSYARENGPYIVSADYKILGIGRFTSNLAFVYPEMCLGLYEEVDKYSLQELKQYKTLFLSGFKWVSKKAAEDLMLAYARQGGRVVIDLTGAPKDVFSNRASFLGVVAEPVILANRPVISFGSTETRLASLPPEHMPWKTFVLEGIDKVSSLVNYYDRKRPIEGYKIYRDQNIYFVGLNLPFYAYLTKDKVVTGMLSHLLQSEVGKTIPREIVEIDGVEFKGSQGHVSFTLPDKLSQSNMVLPIAYLPTMDIKPEGPSGFKTDQIHNLVGFSGKGGKYQMLITNRWPAPTMAGGLLSLLGIAVTILALTGKGMTAKLKTFGRAAIFLIPLLLLFPGISAATENINMDGNFNDWAADRSFVEDPEGDIMDVSDRTEIAGDTRLLYWGTNEGDANLYFSVVRYEPKDRDHKMTGKLFFDIDNNGKYDDDIDKVAFFRYTPNSGKVAVKVYRVNDQNSSPSWHEIGNWGAKRNGNDDGLQFEFYYPFENLGITVNQPIRFYAVTSFISNDNPKQDDQWVNDPSFDDDILFKHDFDLIPDTGDIQIVPVPTMGYVLLGIVAAIGLVAGVIIIKKKKTVDYGQIS